MTTPSPAVEAAKKTIHRGNRLTEFEKLEGDIATIIQSAIDLALAEAQRDTTRLREAVNLALLFHSGSPWDDEKQGKWLHGISALLGDTTGWVADTSATTKNLCSALRAAMQQDGTKP